MNLVVGLGNPGEKYRGTRHNVGFDVLDELARRFYADGPRNRFDAELREVRVSDRKVVLAAPQTFMNLSGRSVRKIVDFYKLPTDQIVIVCDDMNLDAGRLRWRAGGTAGGQKGLNDIINHLNDDAVPRLRIGIGRPPGQMDATAWVLGQPGNDASGIFERAIIRAADSVEEWLRNGLEAAMNKYNAAE